MTVTSKGWRKYVALHVDWCINTFLPNSYFYGNGVKDMLTKLDDDFGENKKFTTSAIAFVMMSEEYLNKNNKTELTISCSDVTAKGAPMQSFKITVEKEAEIFN